MNLLGKILVLANLVFCLITAALISWAYAARTNWHAYAKKLEGSLALQKANVETIEGEAREARQQFDKSILAREEKLKRTEAEREGFRLQAEQDQGQYQAERKKNDIAAINQQSATRELETRQQEVDYLKGLKASQDKKMAELEREKTELRNRAVGADINLKASEERNSSLLTQLETLTKEVERIRAGGTGRPAGGSNIKPPPANVQGTVKAVDRSGGSSPLVTITIGSDSGLSAGNTLDIFRLDPEARYVGVLQILSVRPNEAVGRPMGRTTSPIQVADRVGSSIGN